MFLGGDVYTVNKGQPRAEAVVVTDGRITYVGDDDGARALVQPDSRVVELDRKMLLPGFHDSHMHPMAAGTRFLRCQLQGLLELEAVLDKIGACAEELEEGRWLRAIGLEESFLDSGQLHREKLDAVTAGHPAIVAPSQTRWVWANSAALEAAGIDAHIPDSPFGKVHRDPSSGELTGVLEGDGLNRIWGLSSRYEPEEYREAFRLASEMANGFGITSSAESSASPWHWQAYRQIDQANEMTLRVQLSMRWDEGRGPESINDLLDLKAESTSPRLRLASVKLFLDGSTGNRGSMLQAFVGQPENLGESYYGDKLAPLVVMLDAAGLDVHMHAYGDRAVRDGLDAIEQAQAVNEDRDRRHHMAHLALVDARDLPRFDALGVVADVQPLWAYWGEDRPNEVEALGPERSARLIPVRSLFDSGARVVAGSDWISESMNPLVAIQYAVTRRPLDGSGPAWNPHERASLEQMIEAYTLNGAWLARQEQETGSIEVGKAADLVVLDRNLFDVDPMKISEVRVLLTLLEGEPVYSESTFSASDSISSGMSGILSMSAIQRGSSLSESK